MTETKELKKQAIEKLKNFVQDKSYAKYFKKYKCICDCVMQASENDVEIIKRLDGEIQEITSLQFRADRYYKYVFGSGSLSREYKNNPAYVKTAEIAFFGKIYNVKKENITDLEDFLYDKVLNKNQNGKADKCYVDGRYVIYNNDMSNYYLIRDLKDSYERAYCVANETRLYNNPERQTRLDLSDWVIADSSQVPAVVYPILLNIKDNKGKEIKMYVGKYDLLTDSLVGVDFTRISVPYLFTVEGTRRDLRKSLFKWTW